MGFKNAAQRKAVWASKNEQKKGSPAKQTLGTNTARGGSAYGGHAFHEPKNYSKEQKEKMKNQLKEDFKKAFTYAVDLNGNGKVDNALEAGLGLGSWFVGGGALKGALKGGKWLKGALKSPFKHCDSEMMHSGGWGQVRKYNSPGTTGNKEGIKHNEKMREEIGTFKMPHYSPLNNNDSIAKAWKNFKAGYMNRKEHMGKPITAEENLAEYNREKGEFYYDHNKKKLRLIPTDDGEQKIMKGIDKSQLAPDRKSSISPLNKEGKKDACYHKVKSRVKVWPSAYASGQLVQCRKAGAANWGEKSKKK